MEKQIAQLRREIAKINRTLAEQAEDAGETVADGTTARPTAPRVPSPRSATRRKACPAPSGEPGNGSTAMLLGGIGLLLGLCSARNSTATRAGSTAADDRARRIGRRKPYFRRRPGRALGGHRPPRALPVARDCVLCGRQADRLTSFWTSAFAGLRRTCARQSALPRTDM